MPSSLFYSYIEHNKKQEIVEDLLGKLEDLAEETLSPIYVIDSPLTDNEKYEYEYDYGLIILSPNHKILIVDCINQQPEDFRDYADDFISDVGSIIAKFQYQNVVGRPRNWQKALVEEDLTVDNLLTSLENNDLKEYKISDHTLQKKNELIISLLIGSINDVERVKKEIPTNLLDKVRQKIILFDGDQTRFVYHKPKNQKRITIQGLSGTGKTELLLHKLKELYTETSNPRIMFTCHNRILADNLRERVPSFFDFMRVEKQIAWNEDFWCVHAWGSKKDKNSGAYSYICSFYDIDFLPYSRRNTFDLVCQQALKALKGKKTTQKAFDYMLIDESQDLPESFFYLCEYVTEHTIYVAGDIFQSIFDNVEINRIEPDYLLNKVYRTDPKTLMFAHALGMGLFERPYLTWLEKNEWDACGYKVKESYIAPNNECYELSRQPLRRFQDIEQEKYNSIEMKFYDDKKEGMLLDCLFRILEEIKHDNPTVRASDIAIIFLETSPSIYTLGDILANSIPRSFNWSVNKAYESKEKSKDALFISNINNVKGLEFPFVICVSKQITKNKNYRNALYMAITRSFLRSYLVLEEQINKEIIKSLQSGLANIQNGGILTVEVPSENEKQRILTSIDYSDSSLSVNELIDRAFDNIPIPQKYKDDLRNVVHTVNKDGNFTFEKICNIIETNYLMMKS